MNPAPTRVQCSTASLAPLGGGRYWNVAAVLGGIAALGWPSVELRLWQEWDDGDLARVARRVREAGFTVGSVHIPPDTEALLPMAGQEDGPGQALSSLMDRCLGAALAAGARLAVIHAWDLRLPTFSVDMLLKNLERFSLAYTREGVTLSVENIPGHARMLPLLADACPGLTFTADTRWTAQQGSWELMRGFASRITNLHVQTYIDPAGEGVSLGRLGTCAPFDAEGEVKALLGKGYAGPVTLEPNGVAGAGGVPVRKALEMLNSWVAEVEEAKP